MFVDSEANVKIADFGLQKKVTQNDEMKTRCGTPGFMAPEISNMFCTDAYDGKAVDIFALGVVLYVMILASFPFEDTDDKKYFSFLADPEKAVSKKQKSISIEALQLI